MHAPPGKQLTPESAWELMEHFLETSIRVTVAELLYCRYVNSLNSRFISTYLCKYEWFGPASLCAPSV